jgi:type I restriction enzyme S subunit
MLPQGWATVPIGDLCSLKNGRAFKPSDWTKSGLPIVRIQNLNNREASFNHYSGEVEERYYLKGGELLFAWSGTPGTSFGAHVWRGGEAVLNQHIFRVDFDASSIEKRFFRFAINQKLGELIDIAHGGAGLQHVTKGKFESTEVSIPPLSEQTRIADRLDALLARVGVTRARLDRVPALLKQFRQSVLAAATSGELTREYREIQGASLTGTTLGEIMKVSSGKFLPAKSMAEGGAIPVYGGNGVNGYHNEANVFEATLVIGRVGFYCGSVHMTPASAWVTDNALIVKHDENKTSRKYLFFALQSIDLRTNDSSTAQPVISGQKIYPLAAKLPSLAEQAEIVRRVESLFVLADKVQAQYEAARARVDKLTPALLAKAFRGELVPQDPNDEPAEKLLERLRASKADEGTVTKRRRTKAAAKKTPNKKAKGAR